MTTERSINITPLSQRVAVEKYAAKQLERGMIKVHLWIPEDRHGDALAWAELARLEHENKGETI